MEPLDFWRLLPIALGWMVAHSFWQITLIYLVYQVFSRFFPRRNGLLYAAALFSMAGAALWAAGTLGAAWAEAIHSGASESSGLPAFAPEFPVQAPVAVFSGQVSEPLYLRFERLYAVWAAPVGWFWGFGVLVLSLRLWGGYWMARQLRRRDVAPVPEAWQASCNSWCFYLGLRRPVRWLESARVSGPLTLGFWKPVVLFPAGMLLQLPPWEVEALMLHELAHIRRYDYLVNLLQLALEACFFYHPLFWLLSRAARRHREYCCDDLVLQYTTDPLVYARALTNLQLMFTCNQNRLAMHAIGKNAFAQRILRIAGIRPEKEQRSPVLLLSFILLLLGSGLLRTAFVPGGPSAPAELRVALPEKTAPAAAGPHRAAAAPARMAPQTLLSPLPDTTPPAPLAIELNKMNVFYIGVDNPITVAAPGYDCTNLQVRLEGPGEIAPQGNCAYVVRARQPGEIRIRIYHTSGGGEKMLAVKTFRAKRIPDPVAQPEGFASSTISKADLPEMLNRRLLAMLMNFDYDANCEIVSFYIMGVPPEAKNIDLLEFAIQGNTLPPARQEYLKTLPAGSRIYFTNIKVKCPGDMYARVIQDLVIRIVE